MCERETVGGGRRWGEGGRVAERQAESGDGGGGSESLIG